MNIMETIKISEIIIVLYFSFLIGISVAFYQKYTNKVNYLFEFLKLKYIDELASKKFEDYWSFPLHMENTHMTGQIKHGFFKQYKFISIIKNFDLNDSELQVNIHETKTLLNQSVYLLVLFLISVIIFVIYLVYL